jgi:DNA (cytosine-5)-methyltransferase 1
MSKLKVLDLFSGIGGFSLGLEATGSFETVQFCEISAFPRRIIQKHWPEVPLHGDVRTLDFATVGADVICGGFPCQDISSQGKRAGVSGARSGLYREILRAIRVVRPKYTIMENVAVLLSNGMGTVLGDLAEIRNDAEWHCIPAGELNATHERDRIWIIANAADEQGVHEPYSGEIARRLPTDCATREARLRDAPTPALCGMDDEVPHRVDRTSALGNAVYPPIPELIGHAILEAERAAA